MANHCTGLDPTWAHLPIPAPTHTAHATGSHYYCSSPAWLSSAAAFQNEALTCALRASMAPAAHAYSAATSSFSCPATPSSSTSSASELLSSGGHDAPAPASSRPGGQLPARALAGAGPRGGRVTKRKPRPSRRPPTTYITADAANFRRMVQEITGLPVPSSFPAASEAAATTVAAPIWTPVPACVLPTLDTSAFLLDRAAAVPAPEDKSPGGHASSTATDSGAAVAAAAGDDGSSAMLELEALVCAAAGECGFPTLESWGII